MERGGEEGDEDDNQSEEDESMDVEAGPFSNIKGLIYYKDNEEDPYITLKEVSQSLSPRPSDP